MEWTVARDSYELDYSKEIRFPTINPKKWIFQRIKFWEESLFNELDKVVPLVRAYSFSENNIEKFWVIIENPTSKNILNLSEAYYDFIDQKIHKDDFYSEFLVFGIDEEEYLKFPKDKKILRKK